MAALLLAPLALASCVPERSLHDIAYGEADEQRLDLYLPSGRGPHPVVVYIHGGGWWSGSKSNTSRAEIEQFRARGVAFAAIDYRKLQTATEKGIFPPVLLPLQDSRRALQFLRHNAESYRLDPDRIGAYGSSAGGFNALWLGMHPDQAVPDAIDPVERASTRVVFSAGIDAQTTIDPNQMRQWAGPKLRYGGHAFGLNEKDFDTFLEKRDELKPHIERLSPTALIRADAPPVHLFYDTSKLVERYEHIDMVHSPGFGLGFVRISLRSGHAASMTVSGMEPQRARRAFLDRLADALLEPVAATEPAEAALPIVASR